MVMAELEPRQAAFVREYLVDLNGTKAAIRAGYAEKAAQEQASRLLSKAIVQEAVAEAQKSLIERTGITQERVLERYWAIANADPNELIEWRRANCRHCWGIGGRYQRTEVELDRLMGKPLKEGEDMPDVSGGGGFDRTKEPNPACEECHGEGIGYSHVHDTRRLKGDARKLYAGVKQTKDGLEVKMHDQLAALGMVGRHLGMFKEQIEAKVQIQTKPMSDEQALEEIAALSAQLGGKVRLVVVDEDEESA